MATSTQSRTIPNISRVVLKGPGNLELIQSNQTHLTITADEELLPEIISTVRDDTLYLGYSHRSVLPMDLWRQHISFVLHVVDLNQVSSAGSGRIHCAEFDSDQLEIRVTGSGQVSVDELTADVLNVLLTGSGDVSLAGDVETQRVNIKGSGNYYADSLLSDFGDLRISGSGIASVSVADQLDVFIGGSGKVDYHGFPDVTKQILGSGAVHRVRKDKKTAQIE